MPTYEYKCDACGAAFERFQSIKAEPIRKCPQCGKNKAKRLLGTGAALIFKGSGFYITDYRDSSYAESAKAESGGGSASKSDDAKSGDAKSGDAKSAGDAKAAGGADAKGETKPTSETPAPKPASEAPKPSKGESKKKK